MSLLGQISQDRMTARKEGFKAKATLLTTLYSEAAQKGLDDGKRESTDEEVTAVVRKFIKNINETMKAHGGVCTELLAEKQWLSEYLPQQMTEAQIEAHIHFFHAEGYVTMNEIMSQLKKEFPGQYDGKVASQAARKVLEESEQ